MSSDSSNPYGAAEPSQPSNHEKRSDNDFQEPLPKNEKLINLATFDTSIEANLFRNELSDHGIKSRLANDSTSMLGATIAGQSSAFWIEVLVLESDAQKALQVKNNWNESAPVETTSIPEWNCDCGETVDAGFGVCWNCENEYSPNK